MSNPLVADETVILDADKVATAVARCVEAMLIVNRFEATDESIQAYNPRLQARGRFYPAGYVEETIAEIKLALQGGEDVVDAEANED